VVVVEGPDGAGKTTLVRDLIDRFDLAPAAHTQLSQAERNRLRERNQKEFVYSALAEAVQAHGPIRVHDRMYFSHLVYQPIVDNKPVQFTETFSGQGSYRTLSQVYEMVENYMKFRTERMW
jgi:ABC-type Mn2+/Zn2+ transport system ATPase subunit